MGLNTQVEQLIQDNETWLAQYQTARRADLSRLHSELAKLESRRTELTHRVSQDNADRASQVDLLKTEKAIEGVKEKIRDLRESVRKTIQERRQELAETLNARMTVLEETISAKRSEKERIRTELLPALERQREDLIEQAHSLDADILRLNETISRLNRISIESQDLEFD